MGFIRKLIGTLVALLIVTAASAAQIDLPFKELAGPATEIPDIATADPASTMTLSRIALIPVTLQLREGRWSWSGDIPVEGDTLRLVVLSDKEKKPWRLVQPDLSGDHDVDVPFGEMPISGKLYELHDVDGAHFAVTIESDAESRVMADGRRRTAVRRALSRRAPAHHPS